MKKLLVLLLGITFIAIACNKDEEPALPIDKFAKTYNGSFKEFTCDSIQSLKNLFENYKVEMTKVNDNTLNGKILDDKGSNLFNFEAKLDTANENKVKISNFTYNSETLFGGGDITSGKLKLQFATLSCPAGNNTYKVTRVFEEL